MAKDPLAELVDEYRGRFRSSDQLDFYAGLDSLETAIDYAALAKRPDGKRHSHQTRLKREHLLAVKHALTENRGQLRQARSFADIIRLVRACAVPGFGELAVYDAALRLGAYLNRHPDYVYLHAGTRKGAAALGLKVDREYVALDELPPALRKLRPSEAEDFLCIYKDRLKHPEIYAVETVTGCHKPDPPTERMPTSSCSS